MPMTYSQYGQYATRSLSEKKRAESRAERTETCYNNLSKNGFSALHSSIYNYYHIERVPITSIMHSSRFEFQRGESYLLILMLAGNVNAPMIGIGNDLSFNYKYAGTLKLCVQTIAA